MLPTAPTMISLIVAIALTFPAFAYSAVCVPCQQNAGMWTQWGAWSTCNQNAYGVASQTRTRQCVGGGCAGAGEESRQCQVYRDPTPEWSNWGQWTVCSATCGGGIQVRTRACNTQCGVCTCQGPSTEERACNVQECCNWGAWSQWSACSATCGNGIRTRTRQCSCSQGCTGSSYDQEDCNANVPCPVCNTCYQPPQPIHYDPAPSPCTTCQPIYEPAPVVAPCTTCQQYTPPCSTCGEKQPYYDPYSNGKKKRSLSELLIGQKNSTRPSDN